MIARGINVHLLSFHVGLSFHDLEIIVKADIPVVAKIFQLRPEFSHRGYPRWPDTRKISLVQYTKCSIIFGLQFGQSLDEVFPEPFFDCEDRAQRPTIRSDFERFFVGNRWHLPMRIEVSVIDATGNKVASRTWL
jgi:hypothetical protein